MKTIRLETKYTNFYIVAKDITMATGIDGNHGNQMPSRRVAHEEQFFRVVHACLSSKLLQPIYTSFDGFELLRIKYILVIAKIFLK